MQTSNFPIHVPPPEIESITAVIQKELFRRVTIDWYCFSSKQLEYLTPYLLTAGISGVIEWGWNHFEQSTLLDLTDLKGLSDVFSNPYPLYNQHILKSRGNYDVLIGTISNFEWELQGNKFRCRTEFTSRDRLYAGIPIDSTTITSGDPGTLKGGLRDFLSF